MSVSDLFLQQKNCLEPFSKGSTALFRPRKITVAQNFRGATVNAKRVPFTRVLNLVMKLIVTALALLGFSVAAAAPIAGT